MTLFFAVVFFFSLAGIAALFGMKRWEEKNGREIAPETRRFLDERALHAKELLIAMRHDAAKLPPILLHAAQRTLHGMMVDFARLSYSLARLSHQLADSVSHQRHFIRRETRSEFLKKVSEGVAGGGTDASSTQ